MAPIRVIRPNRFQPFLPRCSMPRPYDNATVNALRCGRVHCQTTVRQPLLTAGTPATTIAIAGSQYRRKARHRLERMSRDLQVVALDSTLLLRFQGYSKIWSAVQSQAKLRSNDGQPGSAAVGCARTSCARRTADPSPRPRTRPGFGMTPNVSQGEEGGTGRRQRRAPCLRGVSFAHYHSLSPTTVNFLVFLSGN